MKTKYDMVIAGAGFAGSLTALILHNQGFRVCLIEKGRHPRFAIGESSTPVADMILRDLSVQYNMPWLHEFSRYGTWKATHPEVSCGLKRGFSFYRHYPDQNFFTDQNHSNELLVAASSDDTLSDTHWFRADFDLFLVNKVVEAGIPYFDQTELITAQRQNKTWTLGSACGKTFSASYFIDATGGTHLLEKLLGISSSSAGFLTNSFSVFSHFCSLPSWSEILAESGISAEDYPYNPDHSALHHIVDEGWVWSLSFDNDITSWGFALDHRQADDSQPAEIIWENILKKYPSLKKIAQSAAMASKPGRLIKTGRLQRKAEYCFGDGWVAMPHSVGFVDPLYSTGFAFSLAGIEKIAEAFALHFTDETNLYRVFEEYQKAVFNELRVIDLLVAGSYRAMSDFRLFTAWSMVYFTLTIKYEQLRLRKLPVGQLFCANDDRLIRLAEETYAELTELTDRPSVSEEAAEAFTNKVRERIRPYNTAGLLDPAARNMYRHTVAKL